MNLNTPLTRRSRQRMVRQVTLMSVGLLVVGGVLSQVLPPLLAGLSTAGLGIGALVLALRLFCITLEEDVSAPLQSMAAAVRETAHGGRNLNLPASGEGELGRLVDAFRLMSDAVRDSETRLNRYATDLELMVSQRTARLQALLDANPLPVFHLIDRRIVAFNQAALSFFGYDADQFFGHTTRLIYADDATYEAVGQRFYATVTAGDIYSQEEQVVRSNGEQVWCVFYGKQVAPEDPAQGCMLVVEDISQRRAMENELRELNRTLEQRVAEEVQKNRDKEQILIQQSRLAAMGEMIGNIAHQWRQPLNALGVVLGNIHCSHTFGELSDELLKSLHDDGMRLVQKMSTTIDDFRNFFRPNKQKIAFSPRVAVMDALHLISASFQARNIRVIVGGDDSLRTLGYPNEFSQVVLNLLSNARDAILAHQVEQGCIEVALAEENSEVSLHVTDNGGGIPPDLLPRIFDPYFSSKENGTGIGLYMSKMIVEGNMGGRITARNVRHGAEFTITLPLASHETENPARRD